MVKELFGERFPIQVISAEQGEGLDDLRTAIYRFLNVIRVYTKQPGIRLYGVAFYVPDRQHAYRIGGSGDRGFHRETQIRPHLGDRRLRWPNCQARPTYCKTRNIVELHM